MVFSYNWLKEYVKNLSAPGKLAELLTMRAFEVGEVKKVGKDYILDIDVLPNRGPDCFSHLGVAREIAAITNSEFQFPFFKLKEDKNFRAENFVLVEVKDKGACPRYTARVITDVKVGPSPKWIQQKLKICGLRAINNIVDITNYVMLETGQPLHAFDGEKIEEKKIIVRAAKKDEKIISLDGEKYNLDEDILVIADLKKPIAIAGIKGGKDPEISKKTKIVVLEAANFAPRVIRKGTRRLGLKTDASLRFEHGIDPNLTELAINRAAYLIHKIARGKVARGLIDIYPKKAYPKKIKLDLDYVENLLGIKISSREIKNILRRLGFKIMDLGNQLMVEVPTFRLDVLIPEDLIEEIGRIYGYEKIPAQFPKEKLAFPERNLDIFWEDFSKNVLRETGFTEVYNYSFVGQKDVEIFDWKNEDLIEIENPISIEYKYLRPSLIPNLLKNVQINLKYFDEIKIFEIGKIFQKTYKKLSPPKIIEKKQLSGILVKKNQKIEPFYQIKGIIDFLLKKMGIATIWYDFYQPTPEQSKISIWHPKKCAEIKINGEEIGFLGELSSRVIENLKLKIKPVVFDIDFEKLLKFASEEIIYRPISKFPAAIRDISVIVPQGVLVVEVLNKINAAGGPLVRDVDLFDIYGGEEIPPQKKSLAFHIVFQAEDRTLKSEEIDQLMQKIIKALEENSEWQVRK